MPEIENPTSRANMMARHNSLMLEVLRSASQMANPIKHEPYQPPAESTTVIAKPDEQREEPQEEIVEEVERVDYVTEDENPEIYTINGVHADLYDYFFIDPSNVSGLLLKKLQSIHQWVVRNGENFRDGLKRLNGLCEGLGGNDIGAEKIVKVFNKIWLDDGDA